MTAGGEPPSRLAADAIAQLEALSAAASKTQAQLAKLVELVGFRTAARLTGIPLGTLQRWVVGVPAADTLDAARQRRSGS